MKFKVKTFGHEGFNKVAQDLLLQAHKDFAPDLYIGIRTGGYVLGQEMMKFSQGNAILLPMTCRRPSTGKKGKIGGLKRLLSGLPYFITNQLRIVEHILLTQLKPPVAREDFVPDEVELAAIKSVLREKGQNARVLIIDDAIDSGGTMLAVYNIIKAEAQQGAIIKTASITVTTENPLIQPDIVLFKYVLCRFPWAFDFKS